ncbi:uncharacterized protein [Mytilus edulis]|uniref:uncharacterized protein isoform X2 n=1 Tax=Mytilus edulis TaxID=6550 RepID=UPI0039F06D23
MKLLLYWLLFNLSIARGNVEWTLSEHTVVFGNDIHLICKLPNDTSCCSEYNRKWTAGVENKLIVMNGISQNKTKYEEELDKRNRISKLTIKSLAETDIDIPYECAYAFLKHTARLQLSDIEYEFHPTEKLPVEPKVEMFKIKVNITLSKVYPIPVCFGNIDKKNLTSYVHVTATKSGIFYRSDISMNYTSSKEDCRGLLLITCIIGNSSFEVVKSNNPCSYGGKQGKLEDIEGVVEIVLPLVLCFFACLAVLVACLVRRRRKRKILKTTSEEESRDKFVTTET